MPVHSRAMVVQNAERKGITVEGGRTETSFARSVARRCWVRGRSDSHMPVLKECRISGCGGWSLIRFGVCGLERGGVDWNEGAVDGIESLQKKRPFHCFRSSRSEKCCFPWR